MGVTLGDDAVGVSRPAVWLTLTTFAAAPYLPRSLPLGCSLTTFSSALSPSLLLLPPSSLPCPGWVFSMLLCAPLQRYITTDHAAWDYFVCVQLSQRLTACRARAGQSEGRAKVEAGHDPSWYGCSAGLVHHRGRYNGESMRRVSRLLMLRRQQRQGRVPSGTVRWGWCITGGVTSMGQCRGLQRGRAAGMEGRVSVQRKGRWGGSSTRQSPQKGL